MKTESPMNRSQLKEKIFNAAWKIVETEGMDQLTVRGIAESSDCSLGSIYNVFDNFQDLQLRINANILSRLYQIYNDTATLGIQNKKLLKEVLRDLGKAYIDFSQRHVFLWKALFEHIPLAPFPDWYVNHSHEGIYLLSKKLAGAYRISEREIKRILGFFWASIHGICAILLNKKMEMFAEFFDPDIHLNPYIEYCINGLLPPSK